MFRFFINNPVFASVISIITVLCGLVAVANLPLSQYPDITPPTLTISAHYPGANAKVIERTVASPIEDEINGASQMIYMNSILSSNGDYNLIITFATGTNLNDVVGDVLNRLNSALPVLPSIVQQLGVTMRKSSQNLLMSISVLSDNSYDQVYLSNYVYRSIYTELIRVKGVGDIALNGDRTYSMRIWLKPDIMAKLNIDIDDIVAAIKEQNIQVAVGKTGSPPTDGKEMVTFNLNGQSYYSNPNEFANIIIRTDGGNYIRIKDVARVELGAQSYDTISKLNNVATVGLQIYLDPTANQLIVHNAVINTLQRLKRQFPQGISYKIAFDNTKFVERALANVIHTLRDACILVVLVILLFLQKGRATLIPILTIPVSLIGSFAIMFAIGFSINNLTLFGLILSIGIVVDDSIVVIENVERIMHERGLGAKLASIETMKEVASALIAIVLVLCAAFIPSAFLSGLIGILYRQFALTISIAVIISGITALTLTPALCAVMLDNKNIVGAAAVSSSAIVAITVRISDWLRKFFSGFNNYFDQLTGFYLQLVKNVINNRAVYLLVFAMISIITGLIYWYIPIGFIPNEDKGYFTTQITLPNNASLNRTEQVADNYVAHMQGEKSVDNNISIIGIDELNASARKSNVATVISDLTDWTLRDKNVDDIIVKANNYGQQQKNAKFVAYNKPAIDGLSDTNGVEFYVVDKVEGNYDNLQYQLNQISRHLKTSRAIADAYYTFDARDTEVQILADIDRAKMYGVNIADIYTTLATNFGPNLVNYFYRMGDLYWVTLQSDSIYRSNPFLLNDLFVRNESGKMVPLNSITTTRFANAPQVIERFNDYLGAKMVVIPNNGYTISQVMQVIDKVVTSALPKNYDYYWYGVSYQQQRGSMHSILAFGFGLILIFLVLSAQFEMWRLPLVVIMGVIFALFGAGVILLLRGLSNDLYFQISLITLLGLSAKNSILITEFAVTYWRNGANIIDATLMAAKKRFRPIIMTSLAFILGAMPLAFATGANSNAEHSVGTGVIGGMIGSTFIATIFVPMFFVVIMGKQKKLIN